jgi:hypothetical protein
MPRQLRLHHDLLLLALHDRKGTLAFGKMIDLGLGGAIMTELVLAERVRIVQEGTRRKKELVEVLDASSTGDAAMDAALEKLGEAKRRANPRQVVSRIGRLRGLRPLVARDLCRWGVLREDEQEILLFFRRRVYPTIDPRPERALVTRVRKALDGGATVDARTGSLIALADVTGTLAAIYDRKDRKRLKARIKNIAATSAAGTGTKQAVEAAQAAVVAAVAAASAAAGASASG